VLVLFLCLPPFSSFGICSLLYFCFSTDTVDISSGGRLLPRIPQFIPNAPRKIRPRAHLITI
jgi:hypothetical protein